MSVQCDSNCTHLCEEWMTPEIKERNFEAFRKLLSDNEQTRKEFIASRVQFILPTMLEGERSRKKTLKKTFSIDFDNALVYVCEAFFKEVYGIHDEYLASVIEQKLRKREEKSNSEIEENASKKMNGIGYPALNEKETSFQAGDSTTFPKIPDDEEKEEIKVIYEEYKSKVKETLSKSGENTHQQPTHQQPHEQAQRPDVTYSRCLICDEYFLAKGVEKKTLEEKFSKHVNDIKNLISEYKRIIESSNSNLFVCHFKIHDFISFPMDREKDSSICLTSFSDVSAFIKTPKFKLFHFSIFRPKDNLTIYYTWHEGEGTNGIFEIASIILSFIEDISFNTSGYFKDFVFYSDPFYGIEEYDIMISVYRYALANLKNINSISHFFR